LTTETLTERRLNRALLARQLLLERSDLPLAEVLAQVGGIQTQYAPSAYIGLWSRLADFDRAQLTSALEDHSAIQATLMRMTIHTVAATDFWPMALALRESRREWLARVNRREMTGLDMDRAAEEFRRELSDGPLKLAELNRRLAARGLTEVPIGWVGLWLDLVRVPPAGTWESRRADIYGLADQWLPSPQGLSAQDASDFVVRRYLAAFGPAYPADIASWSGLPSTVVHAASERIGVVLYRDEQRKKLVDLPGAPLPPEETPAPVRFLPTWDATLLVHARRTQILPEKYRPLVFNTRTPHSIGTFLVDGQVAGSWRYDKKVEFKPFTPLNRSITRQLEHEAARLTAFHA
jgi:hypothetical protein